MKGRKNTKQKHLEISTGTDEIIKNITKSLNLELEGKYYQWQVIEASVRLFEKRLKLMDNDRKLEIMKMTAEF